MYENKNENPLFEEGDIFRTIIPLKKVATQKVGGDDVAQGKVDLAKFIKEKVRSLEKSHFFAYFFISLGYIPLYFLKQALNLL